MSAERRRSPAGRAALGLAALALACLLAAGAALLLRPPSFSTRAEAIGYVLARRGVAYERVGLEQGWPDQINSSTFGANLRVRVAGAGELGGRYECRVADRSCWVAVPELGIDMEPVPDITRAQPHPLLAWLERRADELRRWAAQL